MPGESGNPKGRPKGSKNKFTTLKDAFLGVFEDVGGREGLKDWVNESKANRREFYRMITKMLPANVSVDGDIGHVIYQVSEKYMPKDDEEKE